MSKQQPSKRTSKQANRGAKLNQKKITKAVRNGKSKIKLASKQRNHHANIKNANKGTSGQNKTHAKNQGNRGSQLNPNRNAKPTKTSKK